MKKFLLVVMVILALPAFAQNYTMRISGYMSEDGYEAFDYIYETPEGTDLVCINKHDFITPMEFIDSITRDERGNILRLATWQFFEGEWILACYCDYTYNDMNLRMTRKNYNNLPEEGITLGGTYTYEYDENGNMTDWALDFSGVRYQEATISYNDKGQKEAETIMQYDYATYYLEDAYLTEYEYDENGNMIRSIEYYNDLETWVPNFFKTNEFDEFNNCIKQETRGSENGVVQERRVYEYDLTKKAENVYYYPNPELDFPQLPPMYNMLKSMDYSAQNDANELVPVTTYLFGYEVIGEESVEELSFDASIYPNPVKDYVKIESEADYVEIVDIYGRVMFESEMRGMLNVDMSGFSSGIYFVRLHSDGETSVQKIMK